VGAVLSQEGEATTFQTKTYKPKLHPIAYYSATFIPAERNYDIYERELVMGSSVGTYNKYWACQFYDREVAHDGGLCDCSTSLISNILMD